MKLSPTLKTQTYVDRYELDSVPLTRLFSLIYMTNENPHAYQ